MWLNAITYVKNDKDLIRELKKANKVLVKRVNEESKDTFKKVNCSLYQTMNWPAFFWAPV